MQPRRAGADSTVKMITNEAELPCPQGHDHHLGCRHLHPLEDAPQRDRGHHLGGSSSVWRCSRRGLACSSSSSSRDESFCTCLEHAWSAMKLCSFMRMGELLAQQPVLSGAVVFGVCVCCCVNCLPLRRRYFALSRLSAVLLALRKQQHSSFRFGCCRYVLIDLLSTYKAQMLQ